MEYAFDIEKIARYLDQFKDDLPNLYSWNANIEKLSDYDVFSRTEIENLKQKTPFEKEMILKKAINKRLKETYKKDKTLFDKLCLWIIKDWGGIKTAKDAGTLELIEEFLNAKNHSFKRIASSSKVGSYMYPEKYIIYDSRVAYSLNWIILAENAGDKFFPIPEGRNSKMTAFDMNVLIRLINVNKYKPSELIDLDKRLYVKRSDKLNFIPEKESYEVLNNLIKEISLKLWDEEKAKMLYYTEMLLFSIADREIFRDITERVELKFK